MSSELFTCTIRAEFEQYKRTENQIIVNLYLCDLKDQQYLLYPKMFFFRDIIGINIVDVTVS